jgi:hypothetical protein
LEAHVIPAFTRPSPPKVLILLLLYTLWVAEAHIIPPAPSPSPSPPTQVLILLQALQSQVKPSDPSLRPKQAQEAAALEAEVYAALEATPHAGAAFAAGARAV